MYDALAYKCTECGMIEAPRTGNGCRHCQAVAQVVELTKRLTQARRRMESEIAAREQADKRWLEADERADALQSKLDDAIYEIRNMDERREQG